MRSGPPQTIRTARVAVYTLLGLPKQVPDISPVQYDVRNLLKAARALNNGEPFPGERVLHRLLGKSYFAHILPPLPEAEKAQDKRGFMEDELSWLSSKGSLALKEVSARLDRLGDKLGKR